MEGTGQVRVGAAVAVGVVAAGADVPAGYGDGGAAAGVPPQVHRHLALRLHHIHLFRQRRGRLRRLPLSHRAGAPGSIPSPQPVRSERESGMGRRAKWSSSPG